MIRVLTLLLAAIPLIGRTQHQLAFDTTSTENAIVYTGTVATNGDRVLAVRGSGGTVLWRSSADGTPVWVKQLGQGAPQLLADDAGNVQLLQLLSVEHFEIDQSDYDDTLRVHYLMTQLDESGEVAWARNLSIDWRYVVSWPVVEPPLLIAGQDASFVVFRVWPHFGSAFAILKIDEQGQMVWARSFSNIVDPYNEVNCGVEDGNGGLYLSIAHSPSSWTRLVHVLADGSLGWEKTISYANAPVISSSCYDLVKVPDGSIQIYGSISIPNHFYQSTVLLSPEGMVTDAHFYTLPGSGWAALKAIRRRNDGSFLMVQDSVVVALAANGDVEEAVALTSHVAGDQRNTFIPMAMNCTSEGAVLTGVLDYVHVDLGFTHHRPSVRTIDPFSPGCYTMPVDIGHVPVPAGLYQVEDHSGFQEDTVYVSVTNTAFAPEPFVPVSTSDLCSVMIATGVELVGPQVHQDLQGNVVQQGMHITFLAGEARRVSVTNAAGQTVLKDRLLPAGATTMAAAGWRTGIYLLRVTDQDGGSVRMHRVLVVP